jgi:hypothetical protein
MGHSATPAGGAGGEPTEVVTGSDCAGAEVTGGVLLADGPPEPLVHAAAARTRTEPTAARTRISRSLPARAAEPARRYEVETTVNPVSVPTRTYLP